MEFGRTNKIQKSNHPDFGPCDRTILFTSPLVTFSVPPVPVPAAHVIAKDFSIAKISQASLANLLCFSFARSLAQVMVVVTTEEEEEGMTVIKGVVDHHFISIKVGGRC